MAGANMPAQRDQIEVMRILRIGMQSNVDSSDEKGNHMGGTGKKHEPSKPANDKPKKPERAPVEDDDHEDGDIATPKRDRHGNDDEPL